MEPPLGEEVLAWSCVSFRITMESSNITGLAEVESSQDSQGCVLATVLIKLQLSFTIQL